MNTSIFGDEIPINEIGPAARQVLPAQQRVAAPAQQDVAAESQVPAQGTGHGHTAWTVDDEDA